MRVIKRSGRVEDVKFNKVTNRISKLTNELSESVDVSMVAQQVFSSMYDEIKTHEIDTLSSEVCIGLITCLLYTSPSPRDATLSRMPSSA